MTVSPTATWRSPRTSTGLAVGESSVISLATPCLSLLKRLLKVEGDAAKMTVSPTARRAGRRRWRPCGPLGTAPRTRLTEGQSGRSVAG